jgi:diguanylate cyclase (GGDEF)-like protein
VTPPARSRSTAAGSGTDAAEEHRADRIIAGCPDAFLEIDRGGVVVEWNAGAEEAFGWSRDQVVGQSVTDTLLVAPFARSPFGLLMADTTAAAAAGPMTGSVSGGVLDLLLELRHRDGHRVRSAARLVVMGHGRERTVAGFLRPPSGPAPTAPAAPDSASTRATAPDSAPPPAPGPGAAIPVGPAPMGRDPLTGLADRGTFLVRLAGAAADHAGKPGGVAVVLLDLDRFKAINNSMGHALGDGVLAAVARRLEDVSGGVDLLARFGGDEFLALVTDPSGCAERRAAAFVDRVQTALSSPFPVQGAEIFLDASVGVALNTFGVDDPDDLLAHAEAAMYQAKRRGGFGVETFGESLRIEVLDRMATEHSLHRALERRELMLHYQPVVEVAGATTVGVEALIRWHHPDQGLVAPVRFIPVAEESGLIIPIGAWVLEQACSQLRDWHLLGPADPRGSVEVNLSARQIDDPGIVATVEQILARTGLPPEHLTLEITESALMRDAASALVVLSALKELGVLLAIDDFGTGYSSLSYLQRFPLDVLKVDRMFVEELGMRTGGDEIVSAVIKLAHALGLQVVAEGVETEQQFEVLRSLDCDFAQGFLFSRPVPAAELRALFGRQLSPV